MIIDRTWSHALQNATAYALHILDDDGIHLWVDPTQTSPQGLFEKLPPHSQTLPVEAWQHVGFLHTGYTEVRYAGNFVNKRFVFADTHHNLTALTAIPFPPDTHLRSNRAYVQDTANQTIFASKRVPGADYLTATRLKQPSEHYQTQGWCVLNVPPPPPAPPPLHRNSLQTPIWSPGFNPSRLTDVTPTISLPPMLEMIWRSEPQHLAPSVIIHPKGRFEILDGHSRIAAALALNLERIPVWIWPAKQSRWLPPWNPISYL